MAKLFNAQKGDDVTQLLVILNGFKQLPCDPHMFLTHDERIKQDRGGADRVHSRVNALGRKIA